MSITPLRFSGVSSFSQDFQQIVDRAVSIAQLPVRQIQNQQANLIGRRQALGGLRTAVNGFQSAVSALGSLGSSRGLSVTSTNTTRVSAQLTGQATATSYTITDVASVAAKASESTVSGFANADTASADADGQLELVLGGETFALDLTTYGNNLEGLRDAINESGAGVSATILNTGSGPTPYYLSITANASGATTLALRSQAGNAGSNLLTNSNQGADAVFKLNGIDVQKPDNLITDVIPGVAFTILDETDEGESVLLNLTSSRGTLATKLQNYVDAYNAAAEAVNGQIGENAGLLSGDPVIGQIQRSLREVTGYLGDGDVRSLTDLGVEIDKNGVMSFNPTKFYSLPTAQIEAGYDFLGSPSAGFGGLASRLGQLTAVGGFIPSQLNALDATDRRLSQSVADSVARIERMQATLSQKLQQADALLSSLEGQQTRLGSLLKGLTGSKDQ